MTPMTTLLNFPRTQDATDDENVVADALSRIEEIVERYVSKELVTTEYVLIRKGPATKALIVSYNSPHEITFKIK